MISLKELLLDIPKIFADLIYAYDIFTIYRYGGDGGGIMFYQDIVNKGAIAAYRVLVKIYHDDGLIWEHTYSVIDVDKPVTPMFLYLNKTDGTVHRYVTTIDVVGSIHKNNKYKVSSLSYQYLESVLVVTFDDFTKSPHQMIVPVVRKEIKF